MMMKKWSATSTNTTDQLNDTEDLGYLFSKGKKKVVILVVVVVILLSLSLHTHIHTKFWLFDCSVVMVISSGSHCRALAMLDVNK